MENKKTSMAEIQIIEGKDLPIQNALRTALEKPDSLITTHERLVERFGNEAVASAISKLEGKVQGIIHELLELKARSTSLPSNPSVRNPSNQPSNNGASNVGDRNGANA